MSCYEKIGACESEPFLPSCHPPFPELNLVLGYIYFHSMHRFVTSDQSKQVVNDNADKLSEANTIETLCLRPPQLMIGNLLPI